MASSDLNCAVEAITSRSLHLHSISFFLSQPTSGFSQEEAENSLTTVNISKDSLPFFSTLLSALLNSNTPLANIEFHRVDWEPQQVSILQEFLNDNVSVKRIAFQKNRFSGECLLQLSEILKCNNGVKEVRVSESGIGAAGAAQIANALKLNDSVEELQIWEDSIGSRGAEELSKMIEVNSTLKTLTIFDSSSATAAPLISAVLARNRKMEVHIWCGKNSETSSKVVEFVNDTLRIYRLDVSGTCRVACAMGMNMTVKSLDLTGVRLKSRFAKEFRWVLEQNQTLKEVTLSKTCLKDKGVVYVAAGLFKNYRLEKLCLDGNWFSGVAVEHLLCPLSRFSSLQIQANITLKSVTFGGGRTKIGRDGLAAIVQMLTSNETLTHLGIYDDESLRPDDFIKIFRSLEKNASLKYLSLKGCKGVKGEVLLQTIMEVLQVNPWIESVDLAGTPLHDSGKAVGIHQRLGRNETATTEPDPDLFRDMPLVVPKNCRVFLCGQESAGKTTLFHSISQTSTSTYIDHVRTLVNPVEQAVRPVGMKVKTLKDDDTKISIWNLAGQHDSYSLHDVMFPGPGSASSFLIVSSLFTNRELKPPAEVEEDIQYWLRFIVSNSNRAGQQCVLPNVTIILTHYDKIDRSSSKNLQDIVNSIQRLKLKFHGLVEFHSAVFTVDARSSTSVSKVTDHLRRTSEAILQRVPRVYQLCIDMVHVLSDWRQENGDKPAMKWKDFADMCQIKVPSLRIRRHDKTEKVEMRRRMVASCLHQIGEVIFFEELGFLVLDCEWFSTDVLVQLVRLEVRRNRLITKKELEKALKVIGNLEPRDLMGMMLKLELAYELDLSNPNSPLLIPSILEENRGRPQRWPVTTSNDYLFSGRHFECDDSSHVCLMPSFFPSLQVDLHSKIAALSQQHGATYSLEKYLISININGIYIRVELGGQLGYCIDVLACSSKNLSEALRPIQQIIIPAINGICSGVTLTENVIRPQCVKNLTPPRYRKTQSVSLQMLKEALLSVPADSMYDYQHTWGQVLDSGRSVLESGFDFARDLLPDDDFREVLHRRYHDLSNLASELQVPPESDPEVNNSGEEGIEPSLHGIAKGVDAVLKRLKMIEQEIRDVKQEIQGLRYYEHRLLLELHRKVNYLVNYNLDVEERKVPNMFYFVRTENYSRRIVTNLIPGMTALRLHMLCEYRGEMHVVGDQVGCEVMQVDNRAVQFLAPYVSKFMKLMTFALKIGAHLAVGMGEMIPDLSRGIARMGESSGLVGGAVAAGAVGIGLGAAALRGGRGQTRDIEEDQKAAQQWVVDFLRDRGCFSGRDVADKFGLWRVRYRDDGQIAWVCRRHMNVRAHHIVQVPI